jgi:hypothetical protein
MKLIRRKNNQLVLEEIDLKTSTAIARAITMKPELVHTRIHQVVNASDFGQLLRSLKDVSRPFAVAVINSVEDVK